MPKKKPEDGTAAPRPSKRPPDLSPEAYADHLTTAEILAQSPPLKPRRSSKRETSKSLGVYDADRDILDQYLFEVSKTPLLTAQQEIAIAKLARVGDEVAMLATDSTLYRETTATVIQFRELLTDIQANPKKYLKISVF